MKTSAEFRKSARESLSNKWGFAVGTCLLASILGGANISGVSFIYKRTINIDIDGFKDKLTTMFNVNAPKSLNSIFITMLIVAVIIAFAYTLFGNIIQVGYSKFNLQLIDKSELNINILFEYFKDWKNIICTSLLQTLYILLWSILLIIPGIIATYSYSMTSYILAEHPELTATQAIELSKSIMKGNKLRLFILQLTFIGWDILCAFTFGIGNLWLKPYKHAAIASFYREVSEMNSQINI